MKNRSLKFFIYVAILFLSVILWMIFSPALMNADSIVQYKQALAGNFDDWHPPIMSIVVYYIILMGGGIAVVTFLQVVSGCIGIYYLSKEVLKLLNVVSEKQLIIFPFIILIILLLPISPLSYYLVTFIKDTWLAINLIWLVFLALWLLNKVNSKKKDKAIFLLLLISMSLATVLRHNTLVLLPVFYILIHKILLLRFFKTKNTIKLYSFSVLIGSIPLLLYFILSYSIYFGFDVKKTHPESQIVAMESLGAIAENPELKKELTYITSHLTDNYKEAYIPGNVAPIMKWGPVKAVDSSFTIYNLELREQYFTLYSKAPFTLLKVKFNGFVNMIFPKYRYWFHPQLDKSSIGLVQNRTFKNIRNQLINFSQSIYSHRLFSLLFGEHFIWLSINLVFLFFLLLRRALITNQYLLITLLFPFAYYSSYLMAATGPQFRFMFPATIIVQIITFSVLFSKIQQAVLMRRTSYKL